MQRLSSKSIFRKTEWQNRFFIIFPVNYRSQRNFYKKLEVKSLSYKSAEIFWSQRSLPENGFTIFCVQSKNSRISTIYSTNSWLSLIVVRQFQKAKHTCETEVPAKSESITPPEHKVTSVFVLWFHLHKSWLTLSGTEWLMYSIGTVLLRKKIVNPFSGKFLWLQKITALL